MTPEGRVKQKVKKALDKLGAECWRFMPVQTGFGSPALDYLLAIRGRFVAIETKAPGKKLTPLQEGTKAAIEAAGGLVFVVWDETSLDIAIKIILALEFSPDAPQPTKTDHYSECLDVERKNYTGRWAAERQTEVKGVNPEHVRHGYASAAIDAAASGDHGTSSNPPQRRAVKSARGKDQHPLARVTGFPCESAEFNGPQCKTPCGRCP